VNTQELGELGELAITVAAIMTQRLGQVWHVAGVTGTDYPKAELAGPDHARLELCHNWHSVGKVTVAGIWPDGSTYSAPSANIDPARGAKVIAGEAIRRVLNAGYLGKLPGKVADKAERDRRQAVHDGLLDQAAALFGVSWGRERHETDKVSLSDFLAGRGVVSVWHDQDPPRLNLELNGIPAQVALDMLKVLARSVSGQCCRTYGPGHHPDLAGPGCLRDRGPDDAGERASRRRVVALLKEHGAAPLAITEALEEARNSRYRVSTIEHGGQVLAVVSWDVKDCGEFTVELAGKDSGQPHLSWEESAALFDTWRKSPDGKSWEQFTADRGVLLFPSWR
jgi:hypothetical protein